MATKPKTIIITNANDIEDLVETIQNRVIIRIINLTETPAAMAGVAVVYISTKPTVTVYNGADPGLAIAPGGFIELRKDIGDETEKKWSITSDTNATYISVQEVLKGE